MPAYPLNTSLCINTPPSNSTALSVEVATATSGYDPLVPLGTIVQAQDPHFGPLELIRLSVPTSTAVPVGALATWNSSYGYVACPDTANLGQPVAISMNSVPSNATYVQYAWFVVSGLYPLKSAAAVAADTVIGIGGAGVGGTNGAGKQILNTIVRAASTKTVAKTCYVKNGSTTMIAPNTEGWFVGLYLSGTGIQATTTITAIAADGITVTLSLAANATGSNSITGTYNNSSVYFNVVSCDRPFTQGAVS